MRLNRDNIKDWIVENWIMITIVVMATLVVVSAAVS